MKRKFIILCVLLFSISFFPRVSSAIAVEQEVELQNISTKWVYRIVNGKKQKRLWSASEKKWLTAWLPA